MTPPLLFLWLVSAFSQTLAAPAQQTPPSPPLVWKAALLTGDDRIQAFDNARKALEEEFVELGLAPDHIKSLSASPAAQSETVLPSSAVNLTQALRNLNVGEGDACLLHMTSHGSPIGFMVRNSPPLTPGQLDAIVDSTCGQRPTVLLISACYSGIFVREAMRKPNRIILTAAREDLTSFGCSSESQYTYWDSCLIDNLPKAQDWKGLYGAVTECVERKESLGRFRASKPQAFFGDDVASLKIPAAVAGPLDATTSRCAIADDASYGFAASNAIKVGLDAFTGPARETKYLNALRGPTGQRLTFRRVGSTVGPDRTILDVYEMTYAGLDHPARLFIDEYHFDAPKAPAGFVCGIGIGLSEK